MPRALKQKTLTCITPAREGSTYQIEIEDEAGKRVLFELTSDQTLQLADELDALLADEEEELHLRPAAAQAAPPAPSAPGSLGTVKWYNLTKGFGFVTPDNGGDELFLHRSVLEQAGFGNLAEGTRVRIEVVEGKKGPQVSTITLA
jgi:CspA family cold shock protein